MMCAANAGSDLSPYMLSASQLQAVVDTLAKVYEGKALAHVAASRESRALI